VRAVETVLLLVVVATIVAAVARRLSIPAPSLLVVAGVAVALLPGTPDIEVAPDIVSLVVLPPLLYAAGEELSWRELKKVWRPVAILAVGLVVVSAAAVGGVAIALTTLPVGLAFVLGAVLASTDPVAVSALGRQLSLPGRLQTLVQGESLFNDATSLILFRISLGVALAGTVHWGHIGVEFVLLAVGGAAVGAVVAGGVALIRIRTDDATIVGAIALITPYVVYVCAEALHASGVTAVVVASVSLGAMRTRLTSPRTRLQLSAVYPTVIFLLESAVFSLIGLELPGLVRRLAAAGQSWIWAALAITVTLLVVRALFVLPMALIGVRWAPRSAGRVTAVVSWAGTRGVVPLAAALSIPRLDDSGLPLAGRDLVLVLAVAVIAASLVVQGFTLAAVVGRSGLAVSSASSDSEADLVRRRLDAAAVAYLDESEAVGTAPPMLLDRARRELVARIEAAEQDEADAQRDAYHQLQRDLVAIRARELSLAYADHQVSEVTFHRLQRELDLDDTRLAG
jgi:CPA1 family monovalent cation:H+ antiporter